MSEEGGRGIARGAVDFAIDEHRGSQQADRKALQEFTRALEKRLNSTK